MKQPVRLYIQVCPTEEMPVPWSVAFSTVDHNWTSLVSVSTESCIAGFRPMTFRFRKINLTVSGITANPIRSGPGAFLHNVPRDACVMHNAWPIGRRTDCIYATRWTKFGTQCTGQGVTTLTKFWALSTKWGQNGGLGWLRQNRSFLSRIYTSWYFVNFLVAETEKFGHNTWIHVPSKHIRIDFRKFSV